MTRLQVKDIADIVPNLSQYDSYLTQITGKTLKGVACHALDIAEKQLQSAIEKNSIAVIPIRSGLGIIGGFSETVAAIVRYVGFHSFVTDTTDVSGITEAIERKADIIMMADDNRFIALNLHHSMIVDNNEATAKGFVAGLDLMCGGIKNHNLLILGCGIIGQQIAKSAIRRGASIFMFDINLEASQKAKENLQSETGEEITLANTLSQAIHTHDLIIEATNSPDVIHNDMITSQTYIAAPGMPLGLTANAIEKIGERLFHDPLQTGVAVMAIEATLLQHP